MGSGGYSDYSRPITNNEQEKIEKAKQKERDFLNQDIDSLISRLLSIYNDRDRESAQNRIDQIYSALDIKVEFEKILFGGSVAKHTEVDGLSDIDALVILDKEEYKGNTPKEVLSLFRGILKSKLPQKDIKSISTGKLALTIEYNDGIEIQLLPTLKQRNSIMIPSADGKTWNDTKPKIFQKLLSSVNRKANFALVPAIKLLKSINAELPKQKQLSGYHIEALAVDAMKDYNGPKTPRNVLLHLLGHASERVLKPIKDQTGQSRIADEYLGKAGSVSRRNIAQTLTAMKRRLDTATSISQWRSALGDVE